MAIEQAPAFQLYVKDWRSSRSVARMSYAERGMFLEMLLEQWENHSVPDSPILCADLLGGTAEEWTAAWPVLRRKFEDRRATPRENSESRIVNAKLEDVRRGMNSWKKFARKGGIARAAAAKRREDGTYSPAGSPADVQPVNQPTSSRPAPGGIQLSSSSASASSSATASANKKELVHTPPPKKPVESADTGLMVFADAPLAKTDRFEEFWKAYPRKEGKDHAKRAYQRRRPDKTLHDAMLAAIARQRNWPQWTREGGQFIPHPASWLNAGRWQDQPPAVSMQPELGKTNTRLLNALDHLDG